MVIWTSNSTVTARAFRWEVIHYTLDYGFRYPYTESDLQKETIPGGCAMCVCVPGRKIIAQHRVQSSV